MIGHVVPEAAEGGPLALVRENDIIVIDREKRVINLEVDEEEMERRRKEWVKPEGRYKKGMLVRYSRVVSDASSGACTW